MKIQKAALIGLGAIGSFFAPKLCTYLESDNFRVIADGARRKKIENGITVNGQTYYFPVAAPDEQTGPADLIILAVKDSGLAQALRDIRLQVGEQTQILSVLNGIDSEKKVAAVYGWEHVLYSYMKVSIEMKDSAADYNPETGTVHFGEAQNMKLSERTAAVKALFDASGIGNVVDKDMIRGMWLKFMSNVGGNLTCALLGVPFGVLGVSKEAAAIRRRAMEEVVAIARRLGVDIGQADIEEQDEIFDRVPFHNKPSTLQDLEHGRRTEIDMFAGRVVELGEKLDIETPINWLFYRAIRVYEQKNAGEFDHYA